MDPLFEKNWQDIKALFLSLYSYISALRLQAFLQGSSYLYHYDINDRHKYSFYL